MPVQRFDIHMQAWGAGCASAQNITCHFPCMCQSPFAMLGKGIKFSCFPFLGLYSI